MKLCFNYPEIINSILIESTDSFYFIIVYKYEACSNGEFNQVDLSYVFAGTTMEECQQTMNDLVTNCKPHEDERYNFLACDYPVCADMFYDFDSECDDAEEFILNVIMEEVTHSSDWEELNEGPWCDQTVDYKHESLVDSIILYWQWETHVGYARKPIRLEYCIDNSLTTQNCLPKDNMGAQLTRLVSADEIKKCSSVTELHDLIQKEIHSMGRWVMHIDVDDFIHKLYEDKERFESLYTLPTNK